MLAPVPHVGPGRVLHISVQAEEPDAMAEFQKKLLTRFVTSSGSVHGFIRLYFSELMASVKASVTS